MDLHKKMKTALIISVSALVVASHRHAHPQVIRDPEALEEHPSKHVGHKAKDSRHGHVREWEKAPKYSRIDDSEDYNIDDDEKDYADVEEAEKEVVSIENSKFTGKQWKDLEGDDEDNTNISEDDEDVDSNEVDSDEEEDEDEDSEEENEDSADQDEDDYSDQDEDDNDLEEENDDSN